MGALRKDFSMSFPEKVQTPLGPPIAAGTYTVGTGGNFPTIDSAFIKLSVDGIAGAVTLELINTLYTAPTTQYGFSLNGPIPGAAPNSRVTIKPSANKNVIVEGNGRSVISFLNTSYVTIDGVALTGTATLTIHALYNSQFQWNSGVDFFNNSDHNVIQNVNVISEDYTRDGESIGLLTQSGFTATADSNLIQNNFIKKAPIAIFVGSYNPSVKAIGNIIRGNKIGSETDSLIAWGIQSQYTQNTIIENNIVQNVRYLNNYFSVGINSYVSNGDIIRNNVVHNIYSNGGIYGGVGIMLSGDPGLIGSNSSAYNNMVYDIRSSSSQSGSIVAGIQVWYQNNPQVYYNSVYLSGNGNGANPNGSAALYISSEVTNLKTKSNILVNARDESPSCASSIYDYSTSNLTSDYNDLYYEPNFFNCLVRAGDTYYTTLTEWKATGSDVQSISEMPNFTAPHLHINAAIATYLEKGAIPIAGIDTDFDGQPRNATQPDIGADEFDGTVIPVELISFTASSDGNGATLNWLTATELNNYGFEIQRKVLGGGFATVAFVKGQGTTTQRNQYSFADKNLDEGKYLYRLKQMDYSGQFSYSQVVEVDVRMLNNYSLEQNYPNPFNPTTTIGYVLQEKSNAKLTLLNSLGEEIAVLVNGEQDKGYHKIEFDGTRLSSGVYFYQLKAGTFIDTKKMILLR